jgi:hypothetical protein
MRIVCCCCYALRSMRKASVHRVVRTVCVLITACEYTNSTVLSTPCHISLRGGLTTDLSQQCYRSVPHKHGTGVCLFVVLLHTVTTQQCLQSGTGVVLHMCTAKLLSAALDFASAVLQSRLSTRRHTFAPLIRLNPELICVCLRLIKSSILRTWCLHCRLGC